MSKSKQVTDQPDKVEQEKPLATAKQVVRFGRYRSGRAPIEVAEGVTISFSPVKIGSDYSGRWVFSTDDAEVIKAVRAYVNENPSARIHEI